MKTFATYYFEADKTYEFTVKIAETDSGVSADLLDRIKNACDVFQVETMSKPKSAPISEQPEFHRLGPVRTHTFTMELKYPATAEVLQRLITTRAMIPAQFIAIARAGDAFVVEDQDAEDDAGKQDTVGQKRIDSMLKDFEKNSTKFKTAKAN
jgi:hypothetical protein